MLAAIERDLDDPAFLVVGIHSPKFPAQRDPELVAAAIRRLGVTHPQVLDPDSTITHSFAVTGWPTMILVGPDESILGTIRGEPEPQALLRALGDVMAQARAGQRLNETPLPVRPATDDTGRWRFPGAVAADGDRIAVADTGHDQVALLDATGAETQRLGAGLLRRPCGLALAGDVVWVADTGNHRLVAFGLDGRDPEVVEAPGLRSPWGLAWDGRRLYVASAGTHQLWVLDPAEGALRLFAGTGVEGGRDGPTSEAHFAQPSGIALDEGVLYVADAETSSIRGVADLDGRPVVRTVCGAGDLFGFGDRDGAGPVAELQHPIGLAAGAGAVWVADTFNHKVRRLDPATRRCTTAFGGGGSELDEDPAPGPRGPARPGVPAFLEPEGIAVAGGDLLVADTGNHRVVAVDLASGARRVL